MPRQYRRLSVKIPTDLFRAVELITGYQKEDELADFVVKSLQNGLVLYDTQTGSLLPPLIPIEEYPTCPICQTPVTIEDRPSMPSGYCITCMNVTMMEETTDDSLLPVSKVSDSRAGTGRNPSHNELPRMSPLPRESEKALPASKEKS